MLQWWVEMHGFIQSPSSWIVMIHAERWTMLSQSESSCADREYLRCSRTRDLGPGKWGDQSCSVRWHQALAPHFLSISSTEILWDSVRFYIPQDLLDGVGVVASVRIVSPPNVYIYICLCQRHISGNFSFFCSFAHHSALPMTCRNFPFSRLSLFRCPVAAGLIWDRCLQAERGNVQFLWWIQYRKYMKSQYIELFTHWITKIINIETCVL